MTSSPTPAKSARLFWFAYAAVGLATTAALVIQSARNRGLAEEIAAEQ